MLFLSTLAEISPILVAFLEDNFKSFLYVKLPDIFKF